MASKLLTLSLSDEGHSGKVSCPLSQISMFLSEYSISRFLFTISFITYWYIPIVSAISLKQQNLYLPIKPIKYI